MAHVAIPGFVLHRPSASRRVSSLAAPRHGARLAAALRNWWTMSVQEPPAFAARQTRIVDARGRMVPPR